MFGPRGGPRTLRARVLGNPVARTRRYRRRRNLAIRDLPWATIVVAGGCVAVAVYGFQLAWSATRVHVTATGVEQGMIVTSQAMEDRLVRLSARPTDRGERAVLRLNDAPVDSDTLDVAGATITWRPGPLAEGDHTLSLSVPRPALPAAVFRWRFRVDDTPPAINVPSVFEPVGICQPLTIGGEVEPGATLTVDGQPLRHNGTFALRHDRPPAAPIRLAATDRAGNRTEVEVTVPVRYPGGQGVHATAASWGYEPLRTAILALVDARLISVVELDLKDEGGIVGYDSNIELARTIGAVVPEYRLKDAVADLKQRGVRVIGRIVAFNDPKLSRWAWDNGRRDWVVQTVGGGMWPGGFANHSHPEVHRYNLDIALEAAAAGVDDILWDYVRRPEGDPATMVVPGLQGTSMDAIVTFLSTTASALRERCVYQGASVFGIAAARPDAIGQDIRRMSRTLDYVAPMVYPSHWVAGEYGVRNPNAQPYDIVRASLADFQSKVAGSGRPLMPWLQDFSLGRTYAAADVRAQIDAAAHLGIPDWLLWNAGAAYTRSALDPALVALRP